MEQHFLAKAAACAMVASLVFWATHASAADTPPMAGGYANVMPIAVVDPAVKAIAGALFKPPGVGPFPAVIYLSGCGGLADDPSEGLQEKAVIDRMRAKGVATLIVDPFTPRGELYGVCAQTTPEAARSLFVRGGKDANAAINALKAMPDVDPKRIFLLGYSFGAISSLVAVDSTNAASKEPKVAGVIAYYPYCWDKVDPTVPTLVMIGDKDDWTPAALCQAVKGKANFEVVVYPGATHAFTQPRAQPLDFLQHHIVYDEKATRDGEDRAEAFIAKHIK